MLTTKSVRVKVACEWTRSSCLSLFTNHLNIHRKTLTQEVTRLVQPHSVKFRTPVKGYHYRPFHGFHSDQKMDLKVESPSSAKPATFMSSLPDETIRTLVGNIDAVMFDCDGTTILRLCFLSMKLLLCNVENT